jgi:rhomboid protease GluP
MDFNETLVGLVGLSVLVFAVRVGWERPAPRGWMVVLAILGLTLGLGLWLVPQVAGYLALAAWVLFVLAPTFLQRWAIRLAAAGRARWARWGARAAIFLHPADGWWETGEFVTALLAYHAGDVAAANQSTARLQRSSSTLGRSAVALAVRQSGAWARFVFDVDHSPLREKWLSDGTLLELYLQALGELGQTGRMLAEYRARISGRSHPSAQLRVLALTGDVSGTEHLLAGGLPEWPRDVSDFWRATARQAAGDAAAEESLERLEQGNNRLVAELARRRRRAPLPQLDRAQLDSEDAALLADIHDEALHDARYAVLGGRAGYRPWATFVLAALMLAGFLRELPGGVDDSENLVDLGAIVVPVAGFPAGEGGTELAQWWRPFAAAFLHFGWAHFAMNFVGLLYLGSRLEAAWGWLRTLACFVASVAVSMGLTPLFLLGTSPQGQILLGASGGIMGLLGGLLGHLARGWLTQATPRVANQATTLLVLIGLQTTFDFLHPQISYHAHLLGLAVGFVFGLASGTTRSTDNSVDHRNAGRALQADSEGVTVAGS